jgi:hypothetical protein
MTFWIWQNDKNENRSAITGDKWEYWLQKTHTEEFLDAGTFLYGTVVWTQDYKFVKIHKTVQHKVLPSFWKILKNNQDTHENLGRMYNVNN